MDSIIGLLSILFLFLLITGIILILWRKNFFSPTSMEELDNFGDKNVENGSKLSRLKGENEDLTKEIKFLEEKNTRLRLKIEKMKNVIQDLQEQKSQLEKSERKLKELREQKDDALAMVAHDLKNPASTIKNFVELLESYDLSAQEQQDVLKGLMETSSRLVKLASEFSQVITEEYVQYKLEKSKNNLSEVVDSIVKVNQIKANEKNIELRLYQPDEDLEIFLDSEKIKEVIDNFVNNAIKFCPEKSKIDILTKRTGNDVIVEVKDNGFGLTEEEIAHAFEKGTKLSNKPTGSESSSGLGLWIAKKIVEEHSGKVWLKSKKGFGSTFAFKIPIS